MDVNKEIEKAIQAMDEIGERPNYLNGGSYDEWIQYKMIRDWILDTFIQEFRNGARLSI